MTEWSANRRFLLENWYECRYLSHCAPTPPLTQHWPGLVIG